MARAMSDLEDATSPIKISLQVEFLNSLDNACLFCCLFFPLAHTIMQFPFKTAVVWSKLLGLYRMLFADNNIYLSIYLFNVHVLVYLNVLGTSLSGRNV